MSKIDVLVLVRSKQTVSSGRCVDEGTAVEMGEWGMQERVLLIIRVCRDSTGPVLALLDVMGDLGQEERNLSFEEAQRYWAIEKQPRIQERPMRGEG